MKKQKNSTNTLGQMKQSNNLGEMKLSVIPPKLPDGTPYDGIKYTGDVEVDAATELNEYQLAIKNSKRQYEKSINGIFDTEFWIGVVFKDREEKEEFLKEFGFLGLGDKYIDGGKIAKKLRQLLK